MGESNRVRWQYALESTFGTAPTGQYQELRRTGGALNAPTESSPSDQVSSDYQRTGLYRFGRSAEGTLEAEFSYGSFDELLEACLRGAWTSAETTTGSLTTVSAAKTVSMTGAFSGMVAGQWFRIADSAANDGVYKIATRTSDDQVTVEDDTQMGADATAEAGVTIDNDGMLRNGVVAAKSFTIEQEHLDLTQVLRFLGMRAGGFSLTVPSDGLVTMSMEFMGKDAERSTSSVGSGVDAANTNDVFNGTANIYDVREGSSPLGDDIMGLSFESAMNLRQRRAVANLTPVDIKNGTADFSGQLDIYMADGTLIDKYLAFTETSQSIRMTDGSGNSYVITIPAYKYTGDLPDAGALDGDVVVNLPFTAYKDSVTGCSIQIDRFASS